MVMTLYIKGNPYRVACDYLEKNGVSPDEADITILEDGISILANREVNYFFARRILPVEIWNS